MTRSHWLVHILSQRLVADVYCVASMCRTNSNQFEFVRHVAATKFCRSDIVCRMPRGDMS